MQKFSYRLYHYPLCPFCRKIRILLDENTIEYTLVIEKFWETREKFMNINPAGNVPFLVIKEINSNDDYILLFSYNAITEYLNEFNQKNEFIFGDSISKAKIRNMSFWFDEKFYKESVFPILNERVYLWFKENKRPEEATLELGRKNLKIHLEFIETLLRSSDFIVTTDLSLTDLTAAAHISSLDYLGEINWKIYPILKEWYSIIKSRPSFQKILYDSVSGFQAPKHYTDLDF